jgi:integrase
MARVKEAPYRLTHNNGRAVLVFWSQGARTKVTLGLAYHPERSSAEESRKAHEAAEAEWRRLTDGRVVEEASRVRTDLRLLELYAIYLLQWEPPINATVNERKKLMTAKIICTGYGKAIRTWADDDARRPDGSLRWSGDKRTPLERIVADSGPGEFLSWRLLSVQRKTMKKEKSNLVRFLQWAHAAGYLASVPKVELPAGKGTVHAQMKNSGRGRNIALTMAKAMELVQAMPEWSSRTARNGGERFLVRPFFEFMRLTGLRPATIERLEVGRNWSPGDKSLRLDNEDDKAKFGREVPLLPAAVKILKDYAPESGHIFGHHDYRVHVRAAAEKVLKGEAKQYFGAYHLRYLFITSLVNRKNANVVATQWLVGHKDLSTTSGYVHGDAASAKKMLKEIEGEM